MIGGHSQQTRFHKLSPMMSLDDFINQKETFAQLSNVRRHLRKRKKIRKGTVRLVFCLG